MEIAYLKRRKLHKEEGKRQNEAKWERLRVEIALMERAWKPLDDAARAHAAGLVVPATTMDPQHRADAERLERELSYRPPEAWRNPAEAITDEALWRDQRERERASGLLVDTTSSSSETMEDLHRWEAEYAAAADEEDTNPSHPPNSNSVSNIFDIDAAAWQYSNMNIREEPRSENQEFPPAVENLGWDMPPRGSSVQNEWEIGMKQSKSPSITIRQGSVARATPTPQQPASTPTPKLRSHPGGSLFCDDSPSRAVKQEELDRHDFWDQSFSTTKGSYVNGSSALTQGRNHNVSIELASDDDEDITLY